MIADPTIKGAEHSWECGYGNELMKKMFEGVTLGQLLVYGAQRAAKKERLDTDRFRHLVPKRASSRSISLTSLRAVSSESLWDRAVR
jgi:hypothetical protein